MSEAGGRGTRPADPLAARARRGGGRDPGRGRDRWPAGPERGRQAARRGPRRRSTTRDRRGGLGASAPRVARWLGDIRGYFPTERRPGHAGRRDGPARAAPAAARARDDAGGHARRRTWSAPWSGLGRAIPEHSRETARTVVRGVTDQLEERLRATHRAGRHRRARPVGAHPPAQAARRRLAAHDRGEPQALPARAPHRRARAARRLRPPDPPGRARHRAVHRPVRVDGRVGRLLQRVRRGARLAALGADPAGRLRHRGRRPDRRPRRPGRRAVRRPARRRDRHQPRAGVLRERHRTPGRHDAGPHQRPLRGRHRRGDADAVPRPWSAPA